MVRHVCGISGGKDSALAVYMRNKVPNMEYFFCDTGAELPETYTYLKKLEAVLGKPIVRLNSSRGFDHYFEVFRGTLPSPQMRWCTKLLKSFKRNLQYHKKVFHIWYFISHINRQCAKSFKCIAKLYVLN